MKKNFKKVVLFLFITFYSSCFCQEKFYQIEDKIYNQEDYDYQRKGMIESGNVMVELTDSITRNDSIIHNVKLTMLDPFERHRKKIGTYFSLESFKNEKKINFPSNYLKGKPSLINFWFTRCPPCIKELPALSAIKEEFKNKVNFIAINFEEQELVNKFLETHKFNFYHITNAMKELDDLKINAFPMNIILDKDGKIISVLPAVEDDGKEISLELKKMLQ